MPVMKEPSSTERYILNAQSLQAFFVKRSNMINPQVNFLNFVFICKDNDGIYLVDKNNYILSKNDMLNLATEIQKFAEAHENDIEIYNQKHKTQIEQLSSIGTSSKQKQKRVIYILYCNGKYKIGISKDVFMRTKQLNNRPFKVEIIYSSAPTSMATTIEKRLHSLYKDKRIGNSEWFNLDEKDLQDIKSYIKEVL